MYAIIKNGGKQYKVQEGDILDPDYLGKESKEIFDIEDVLCVNDGSLKLNDDASSYKVQVQVILDGTGTNRAKKIIIFKKRRRKDSKLKRGFRRSFTKVKVLKISN